VSKGHVDHRRLLTVLLGVALIQAMVTTGILAPFRDHPAFAWMLPASGRLAAVFLIGALLFILQSQQLARAVVSGCGRFDAFSASEVIARAGALLLVIALLLLGIRQPQPVILTYGLAVLASVVFVIGIVWRMPRGMGLLPLTGIVAYSLPLFLGNILQFMNYRLDIFFIKGYLGLGALGRYTVAVGLAQFLWLIPSALSSLVMRAAAEQGGTMRVLQRTAEVTRFCLWLSAAGGVALIIAAEVALTAVFGSDFEGSVHPLVILVPGVVLFCPTIILSAYLNGIRRQLYTTWVAGGSLVLTVVLNVLLLPRIGIAGAAVASSAAYTVSSAITLLLVLRLHRSLSAAPFLVPQTSDISRTLRFARAWLAHRATRGPARS
jgi:O-antigen/teichoic acid export membrane protein